MSSERVSSIFKLLVVGPQKVGKTTLINRIVSGEFDQNYVPTKGVEITFVKFAMDKDHDITFNCWDCAGNPDLQGLKEGYYIGGQAAIVMFNASDPLSFRDAKKYASDVQRICGNIPIVYCAIQENPQRRQRLHHIKEPFISISSKDNKNIMHPFLTLARQLMNEK